MKLIKAIYQYDDKEEFQNHRPKMEKQNYRWTYIQPKELYNKRFIFEVEYIINERIIR